ncbi:MAG: cytochrome P450 [Streptosporangiales bacterium]|nr:cytochrome P450 [Streptosporangiales bacterium]
MTVEPLDLDSVDLSMEEFWAAPLATREAAFAALRAHRAPRFFPEPELEGIEPGPGFYALVHHADIVEASRNPEVFSSVPASTSIFDLPTEFNEFFGSMINMDDPRHARLRRIVSRGFTPKMLAKLEEDVQRAAAVIVDDLLEKGSCDFVTEVAAKLPLKIICDMMGIPESKFDFVFTRSNVILGGGDQEYVSQEDQLGQLLTAGAELAALVGEMAAERRANPTEDLTSALANANVDGESLDDAELGSFFILLAVAGNETTRNAISHGLKLLTDHPDQRELWASDFERYAPGAVEEIVRYASPVMYMRRTLTRDFVLNGNPFKEGDKVALYYWSANRDESVFDDPYTFDITRDPNPHVGFGGPGPHFCLGAHLARREITVMFRELFARAPGLRAVGEPDQLLSDFINGVKHLRCEVA